MNYLIKYSPQKFSNLQNYDLYWVINILNLSVRDFQTLTRHKKLLKIKLTASKLSKSYLWVQLFTTPIQLLMFINEYGKQNYGSELS